MHKPGSDIATEFFLCVTLNILKSIFENIWKEKHKIL